MEKPTLLVLAAGIGSRYGSLKQLDSLGPNGETIIDYSVFDAIRAGFGKVVFVIRHHFENEFRDVLLNRFSGRIAVDYVFQEIENIPAGISIHPDRQKPWGTGHAVLMAKEIIHEPFAVINADDFYGADAFRVMAAFLHKASGSNYAMVGYRLENTLSEFGSVSRGVCEIEADYLIRIDERINITRNEGDTIAYLNENGVAVTLQPGTVVSMNFWGFTPDFFRQLQNSFDEFIVSNAQTLKSEFYIPTVVNQLVNQGAASVKVLKSSAEWFGVTYREDRESAVSHIQKLVKAQLYPHSLWR